MQEAKKTLDESPSVQQNDVIPAITVAEMISERDSTIAHLRKRSVVLSNRVFELTSQVSQLTEQLAARTENKVN